MNVSKFRLMQAGIAKIIEHVANSTPEQLAKEEKDYNDKIQALKDKGYVLIGGLNENQCYTEQDILDGKTGLNGTLYHMGYRHNGDGTRRKKRINED